MNPIQISVPFELTSENTRGIISYNENGEKVLCVRIYGKFDCQWDLTIKGKDAEEMINWPIVWE